MNQTESRPWLTALAIALGAPAVLAACASSQFDSYIDAGQYEDAIYYAYVLRTASEGWTRVRSSAHGPTGTLCARG